MAKVSGPLFSMSASGTIGEAVTYGTWKGQPWARVWFKPQNPQTAKQVNVRTALALTVAYWQATLTQAQKDAYEVGAEGQRKSGFNLYVQRAMDAYITQLTSANTPVSVSVLGDYPSDVFTWT